MSRSKGDGKKPKVSRSKGDGKKPKVSGSSLQLLSMPVTVLSREEDTGLTVYGGEFGARASASMNKEVERMIEEKEKQEGSNEGAQSRKEVRATLQTAARGSKNTWKEKEKEEKKEKKIRSVKQMRAVVSARDNPYPRKPMTRQQYCCLKKFWIAGSYLWFRWQTPETEEESRRRMEEMMGRHQASVHCEKTARKTMTKSRAKKLRQSKNGKASLDAEVWGITDISKQLSTTHHS